MEVSLSTMLLTNRPKICKEFATLSSIKIVVRDGEISYDDYQLQISKDELAINTVRLAQMVRCAIIYLCNFVMHAEYDKFDKNLRAG